MKRKFAALMAAVVSMSCASHGFAAEMFDRNTLLGARQQTGPAVIAYFRTDIVKLTPGIAAIMSR